MSYLHVVVVNPCMNPGHSLEEWRKGMRGGKEGKREGLADPRVVIHESTAWRFFLMMFFLHSSFRRMIVMLRIVMLCFASLRLLSSQLLFVTSHINFDTRRERTAWAADRTRLEFTRGTKTSYPETSLTWEKWCMLDILPLFYKYRSIVRLTIVLRRRREGGYDMTWWCWGPKVRGGYGLPPSIITWGVLLSEYP